MGFILRPVDVDVSTLVSVNSNLLNLDSALSELLAGSILIVKDYEATTNADTYVKLALERPKPVTRVTYTNPSLSSTVWQPEPVPLNAFSINRVYKFDSAIEPFDSIYRPGDVIKYTDTDGRNVAGIVSKIYKDSSGKIYYQFTNGNTIYRLEQSGQGIYQDQSDGSKPFIPVADTTKDGTTVIVRDNRDKIIVPI